MKIAQTNAKALFESKGGMFDVKNAEMEANIGKKVTFTNPDCPFQRETEGLYIEGIQKNYKSEIIYRISWPGDNFGYPAHPDLLTIHD